MTTPDARSNVEALNRALGSATAASGRITVAGESVPYRRIDAPTPAVTLSAGPGEEVVLFAGSLVRHDRFPVGLPFVPGHDCVVSRNDDDSSATWFFSDEAGTSILVAALESDGWTLGGSDSAALGIRLLTFARDAQERRLMLTETPAFISAVLFPPD